MDVRSGASSMSSSGDVSIGSADGSTSGGVSLSSGTATGGSSAQVMWDEGGQEIVDLGAKGVSFVDEKTKLKFVDGKLSPCVRATRRAAARARAPQPRAGRAPRPPRRPSGRAARARRRCRRRLSSHFGLRSCLLDGCGAPLALDGRRGAVTGRAAVGVSRRGGAGDGVTGVV